MKKKGLLVSSLSVSLKYSIFLRRMKNEKERFIGK